MMRGRTCANGINLNLAYTHKAAKLPAISISNSSYARRMLFKRVYSVEPNLSSGVLVGGAYVALKADTSRICTLIPMLMRSRNQLAKGNALRI